MARPINADGQRTRQAILDAALSLFAEKGYFGTSLRDLAGAVGVRESALYNYFPSKDALFEALLTADAALKSEQMAALHDLDPADARSVLERVATLSIERYLEPRQQQLFRILMSDGIRLARDGRINLLERMGSGRKHMYALLQRLIDAGSIGDGDVEQLAAAFFGPLLYWRQLHAAGADSSILTDRAAFVRQHVDHFLNGAASPVVKVSAAARRATA
ncbi:MAG: TetR/AcrR family transcriptional regulator [Vicinamibacterales bacterium]